tara:strand:+ start:949 stop:1179 length:231 start_codon:yes stop_codon:yes gene_type:complete
MFNCKIYHPQGDCNQEGTLDNILHNKNYKTLKEISSELGLTYQQVADLSSRKQLKKYQEFKYFPKIEIKRIKKQSL